MVVGRPGTLLGPLELSICLGSANWNTKPMSPERKSEEDCRWEPPVEEMEGDSLSSEGGRMTDSTDDEETSSTESARTPEEMPGNLTQQEEVSGTLYRQEDDVGTLSQPEEVVGALSQQKEMTGSLHKQGEVVGSQVQRRLEVEQMKVMNRISQLEQQIRELQLQRREVNIEVEMEVALLEGELRTERKEMDREEELIQALHDHLRETERRMQEERDKDKLRLKDEKMKIKELEQNISACRAQLDKQPESLREQLRKQIQEMTEMVEGAMKSFEDLEFQQLERESSREEEREASYRHISESISKHQNELNQRKDKILRLEEQIRGAEEQAQEERQRLSDENSCVFQSLNKEKERLMALGALCGKEPSQPGQESKPRKGLQRTSSLPRRRGNAPFLRPTDRPVSLHGNTCLENAGLAVHLAVSSSSTGGKIALAISPNLQSTRARNTQREKRKGINGGNPVNGHAMVPLNYGPMPKIAEMERQLREAMAEKERLLKAREAKRVAKEMTHRSEPNQNKVKEETAVTTSAVTMQPHQVTMEPAGDPVKALSVPRTPSPFDLRAYLEASGHSVETCLHVKVSSMCCKGYLVKMGGRIKTWKKRWFVFDRQKRRLAYYSDKEEQKLKGVIYFQAIEEVYYDHLRSASKSPHPKLTFCLKTFERLFCMVAPTPEAMRIWMDVMVTAAEENSRY